MGMSASTGDNPWILLEQDQSTACPECGRVLSTNEQSEHLLSRHGYVDLAGMVMLTGQINRPSNISKTKATHIV